MSIEDVTEKLHLNLAEDLLTRIQSGQATAAELNVARQFLKDNGVDSLAFQESPLIKLSDILPFGDKEAM